MFKRVYGILVQDYERVYKEQGGLCKICRGLPIGVGRLNGRLSVDHNHATKKVRGLLCSGCNTGIGAFKDDPKILRAAAAYLEEHSVIMTEAEDGKLIPFPSKNAVSQGG